jgi:hypothetical protein
MPDVSGVNAHSGVLVPLLLGCVLAETGPLEDEHEIVTSHVDPRLDGRRHRHELPAFRTDAVQDAPEFLDVRILDGLDPVLPRRVLDHKRQSTSKSSA